MPERDRAVTRMLELLANDGQPFVWDGLTGTIRPGQALSTDEYEAGLEWIDEVWGEVMDRVNWSRILIAASGLHLGAVEKAETGGPSHPASMAMIAEVCGLCIRDALLSREH